MDRKFFYLLTVLLFSLFHLSAVYAADTGKKGFPFKGGKTSDGITIKKPKMDGFKLKEENSLQVVNNSEYATMTFNVTVPQGKSASLQYKVLLKVLSKNQYESVPGNTRVAFTVKVDDKENLSHSEDSPHLSYSSDQVTISSGAHKVSLEAVFTAQFKKCITTGYIDSLSIHIHDFGKPQVTRTATCESTGESHATCSICGKDSTIITPPPSNGHSLRVYGKAPASCFSSTDSVYECERCPYNVTKHFGARQDHSFDGDGKCTVCGLHLPKSNANHSVYEINDAGEMRVLAELVSIGRIPGNIGVDIKADLEFTKDLTMFPLGTVDNPFQGVLNGNGHRISGITSAYQDIDCLGFVGVAKGTLLSHAVIANLIFDSGNTLKGSACIGGIVGYATNCDIVNCASFGYFEGNDNIGGIVGFADQQVSILNSASVATIRTDGTWNTMVCGMPMGHILNSYGAATNEREGNFDMLETTTLRHCFSSQGSGDGLTQVGDGMLTSYSMVESLNEQSESPCFMMSQKDIYPIPVVNTDIIAKPNDSIPTVYQAYRRAAPVILTDDELSEKDRMETEVSKGYVDEDASRKYGSTIEEVMQADSIEYNDFDRLYIVTRTVPEDYDVYEKISGGNLLDFESYLMPADSSYLSMKEYNLVASNKVKVMSETVTYSSDHKEIIDQYKYENGTYSLKSRVTIENEYNMLCEENVKGIMKPVWRIETKFDKSGNAIATYAYSYNYKTGQSHLDYSYKYDNEGNGDTEEEKGYIEYLDSLDNTIHIMYFIPDSISEGTAVRDHYILRASDQMLLENRTETVIDGTPYLINGVYFIYDEEGYWLQSVAYGPTDKNSPGTDLRPYLYHEYIGVKKANPFPTTTAIKVPTTQQPSTQKRMDINVYDMHGRVVRRANDMKDPFSGLPRGIYIYQGNKYLKR